MSDAVEGKMLLYDDFMRELSILEERGDVIPRGHPIWKKARALGFRGYHPEDDDEDDESAQTEAGAQVEANETELIQPEAARAETEASQSDAEASQSEEEGANIEGSNEEAARINISTAEDFRALGLENEAKDTDEMSPDWAGQAAKYEWKAEYGDVGPADPRLEKMLFYSEHAVRKGVEYAT